MQDPQPIETAPTDGTTILTDSGIVCRMPYHGRAPGWVACDPHGEPFKCQEDGYTYCFPAKWTPLPDWVK